jgi:hypothetical protein
LLRRERTLKVVFGKPGNVSRRVILILFKDMLRRRTCAGGRGRRNETGKICFPFYPQDSEENTEGEVNVVFAKI